MSLLNLRRLELVNGLNRTVCQIHSPTIRIQILSTLLSWARCWLTLFAKSFWWSSPYFH